MEVAQVNLPVGLLIWVMIIPMLVKVDFGALHEVKQHVRGIGVTLFVNWLVKPFSMAFWLAVRAPPVCADAAGRSARQLHRRAHPAGRGAVHGDGVRVEPADQRRPAVHLSQVALNDTSWCSPLRRWWACCWASRPSPCPGTPC
jgi:ACR3 family arsenite transporter